MRGSAPRRFAEVTTARDGRRVSITRSRASLARNRAGRSAGAGNRRSGNRCRPTDGGYVTEPARGILESAVPPLAMKAVCVVTRHRATLHTIGARGLARRPSWWSAAISDDTSRQHCVWRGRRCGRAPCSAGAAAHSGTVREICWLRRRARNFVRRSNRRVGCASCPRGGRRRCDDESEQCQRVSQHSSGSALK